ncbi:MAG TPA: YgiQ family radical SAM protein [Deltaproteobacteria bacterium]|nr:YgiQ family radical SAM protein [Deltaproteobacteria bacterium]
MFLPATRKEMHALGWDRLDIVLVTGDAYIDSPHIGVAVVGKALVHAGFRVGIISQPDVATGDDIMRLGEPELYWGVTSGSVDSMVANYTPLKKPRRTDDYTPGGMNTRRPDRATIVYTNLIRRHAGRRAFVVLGGIEASLRRIAHYDYWSDAMRRSILLDAKADVIVYGMGEYTAVELARRLAAGRDYRDMRGICYVADTPPEGCVTLPSFEMVHADADALTDMFHLFARYSDPTSGTVMCQQHSGRILVHNPPWPTPGTNELDEVYGLGYEREVHPLDRSRGEVRAIETIRFSLTTHRGCAGGCSFCSIAVHEGPVVSRSARSIVEEAGRMASHPRFRGIITDVGGPSANMYGLTCTKGRSPACTQTRCLFPRPCPHLKADHRAQVDLLRTLRGMERVRKVFVASGIRHDLVFSDPSGAMAYMEELAAHHVSGQIKLAPEHCVERVLALMAKPGTDHLLEFRRIFEEMSRRFGKSQYLTYYFMAAHPGCTTSDMSALRAYALRHLGLVPEQVQIFTPTPSTWSTLMYRTGRDPFTGETIFVEKSLKGKRHQKDILTARRHGHR